MPTRAARPCRTPGCSALVTDRLGFCPAHRARHHAEIDARRPSSSARGYDGEWRARRASILAANPTCECGAKATDVDHIIPLSAGGTHHDANLRAMCHRCHSSRTARDQGFGRAYRATA